MPRPKGIDAKNRQFRELIEKASSTIAIAQIYSSDGAYLTAAERCLEASELFRQAHVIRVESLKQIMAAEY